MKVLVEFSYTPKHREQVPRFLKEGGLDTEGGLTLKGAWIAIQTGVGYALVDVKSPLELHRACSQWSDLGEVKITPVIPASEV